MNEYQIIIATISLNDPNNPHIEIYNELIKRLNDIMENLKKVLNDQRFIAEFANEKKEYSYIEFFRDVDYRDSTNFKQEFDGYDSKKYTNFNLMK